MPRPELSATRSLASLYSSAPQRLAITALTALEREIGESLRPGLDHQVAHTRLAWWREECARTAQGRPSHPLTRELAALFAAIGAEPLTGLAGLVDVTLWDLSCATFDTRRELTAYCERWSAAVIAPVMGLALPGRPLPQAHAFGVSLREIELLLALAPDARAGRLRVPLDELGRAGVPPESLAVPPWAPALAALLRDRHQALRLALWDAAGSLAPEARRPLRGLIVWATMACTASARAEKCLPRASSLRDRHALLDAWRAWRAARRLDRHAGESTFRA
ncbi:MAG TPA: squalene/phytoene synthase family protein [Steroidobacteraceae bacterium]|jgi:phytoene synthase|nr:squalene/phytoene synthase family protein [Steroidobacteraceae bacterium]